MGWGWRSRNQAVFSEPGRYAGLGGMKKMMGSKPYPLCVLPSTYADPFQLFCMIDTKKLKLLRAIRLRIWHLHHTSDGEMASSYVVESFVRK